MSEKFTASNGVTVDQLPDEEGYASFSIGEGQNNLLFTSSEVVAMREFFQHERDQELGRWRSLVGFFVYPMGEHEGKRVVRVLHEHSAQSHTFHEGDDFRGLGGFHEAANDYFDAHPVSKPWHDAKPGEVWVLNTGKESGDHAWTVDPDYGGGRFVYVGGLSNIPLDHPDITAGRRIWPEVA